MGTGQGGAPREWLLLTHHLPAKPAYLRVKVNRKLERIGAVALKNSVYVLPPTDEAREDFEWLRREIDDNGGETSLCVATFVDETTEQRLVTGFRAARQRDYGEVAEAAVELREQLTRSAGGRELAPARARASSLRARLAAIEAIDFFDAPGAAEAGNALDDLAARLRDATPERVADNRDAQFVGRTWVTREGVHVDRICSAWLIRRFIDPAARFKFVPARGYRVEAGELRFDMFGGEFTHTADACTFEVLRDRFELDEPALRVIGEIVHDIDCKDDKFGRAEVAGVASLVSGITAASDDDAARIARGSDALDGLYEHFRRRRG